MSFAWLRSPNNANLWYKHPRVARAGCILVLSAPCVLSGPITLVPASSSDVKDVIQKNLASSQRKLVSILPKQANSHLTPRIHTVVRASIPGNFSDSVAVIPRLAIPITPVQQSVASQENDVLQSAQAPVYAPSNGGPPNQVFMQQQGVPVLHASEYPKSCGPRQTENKMQQDRRRERNSLKSNQAGNTVRQPNIGIQLRSRTPQLPTASTSSALWTHSVTIASTLGSPSAPTQRSALRCVSVNGALRAQLVQAPANGGPPNRVFVARKSLPVLLARGCTSSEARNPVEPPHAMTPQLAAASSSTVVWTIPRFTVASPATSQNLNRSPVTREGGTARSDAGRTGQVIYPAQSSAGKPTPTDTPIPVLYATVPAVDRQPQLEAQTASGQSLIGSLHSENLEASSTTHAIAAASEQRQAELEEEGVNPLGLKIGSVLSVEQAAKFWNQNVEENGTGSPDATNVENDKSSCYETARRPCRTTPESCKCQGLTGNELLGDQMQASPICISSRCDTCTQLSLV